MHSLFELLISKKELLPTPPQTQNTTQSHSDWLYRETQRSSKLVLKQADPNYLQCFTDVYSISSQKPHWKGLLIGLIVFPTLKGDNFNKYLNVSCCEIMCEIKPTHGEKT